MLDRWIDSKLPENHTHVDSYLAQKIFIKKWRKHKICKNQFYKTNAAIYVTPKSGKKTCKKEMILTNGNFTENGLKNKIKIKTMRKNERFEGEKVKSTTI